MRCSGFRGLLGLAPAASTRALGRLGRGRRVGGRRPVLPRLLGLPTVVRAVEPGALVVHGDGMQDALQRTFATHLARRGPVLGHAVEHLEEMAVGALVLIDRHGAGRVPAGPTRLAWAA